VRKAKKSPRTCLNYNCDYFFFSTHYCAIGRAKRFPIVRVSLRKQRGASFHPSHAVHDEFLIGSSLITEKRKKRKKRSLEAVRPYIQIMSASKGIEACECFTSLFITSDFLSHYRWSERVREKKAFHPSALVSKAIRTDKR
jgi:hypothetical protein